MMTIPATISGGASIFQVRLSSGEVLSPGDKADVLFAFYQHSYDGHIGNIRKGGVLWFTTATMWSRVRSSLTDYRHIGIPISSLTVEAIGGTGRDKGKNIFALGLVAGMFSLDATKLERLINERFGAKGESVVQTALDAFQAGYRYQSDDITNLFQTGPGRGGTRQPGGDVRQRGAGLRVDRGRGSFRRRLPDYTVVGHHGAAPARVAQVRRHIRPMRGRDCLRLDGDRCWLRRAGGGHRLERAGHLPQDRGHWLGDHGGDAAGGHRRAAWRALHRVADRCRAVRSQYRLLRWPWRFASRCAGRLRRGGLFLHRHRGGEYRPQIQRPRVRAQRPGHSHSHRGFQRAGPENDLSGRQAGCEPRGVSQAV